MDIQKLDKFPYRTINEYKNIYPNTPIDTIKGQLFNMNEKGIICRLKKGFYVNKNFLKYYKDRGYTYFLANQLYQPSYISTTSALDYYSILSESTFGRSSVSKNKTFRLNNTLGNFQYRNIKSELFIGFEIKKIGNFDVFFASKAKALFDYFWYRKKMFKYFNSEELLSFRMNLELLTKKDLQEFGKYVRISKSKKMEKFYLLLKETCETLS